MFRSPTQRSNRRRLLVFATTFAVVLLVGMVYNFSRPALYLATARVQINPGAVQVEAVSANGGTQGVNTARSLQSELQVLTSKPLLQAAIAQLPATMQAQIAALGPDPALVLQAGLEARAADGTNVVSISSSATDPGLAAGLVNRMLSAYQERLERDYQATAGDSVTQAQEEVARLERRVQEKRRQIEEFRLRHDIVSLEREENDMLGRTRGQTDALNKAQERLAVAEGKVRSARQTAASGRTMAQTQPPRPNATLTNLEQRASALREELSELGRLYTPAYLAIDPKSRAVRDRLAEIERQIAQQAELDHRAATAEQANSRDAALTVAEEDWAAARVAVEKLQSQAAASRGAIQQFAGRFNEYRNLSSELAPIESLLKEATQRKARLEAGERARRPSVVVLEPATPPRDSWQPQYGRDAMAIGGGALVLALCMLGVVELFNRVEPPPTVMVQQPVAVYGGAHLPGISNAGPAFPALAAASVDDIGAAPSPPRLPLPTPALPRELTESEVAALLANASAPVQLFIHLMLRGLGSAEALNLRTDDLDPDALTVRLSGPVVRSVRWSAQFFAHLAASATSDGQACLLGGKEAPMTEDAMAEQLIYTAHDAGLEHPTDVTAEALRHTCAMHLVRQGIRLSDLSSLLGPLGKEQAATYASIAPVGRRLSLDQVDLVLASARLADES